MTNVSKKFLRDLMALCARHRVEISTASRFWVYGPRRRRQFEVVGVVNHLELATLPAKNRGYLREKCGVAASCLTVLDLTNEPVRFLGGEEDALLGGAPFCDVPGRQRVKLKGKR